MASFYNVPLAEGNETFPINETVEDDRSSKLGVFGIILIIIIFLFVGFFLSAFIAGIIEYRRKRARGIPIERKKSEDKLAVKKKRKMREKTTGRSLFDERKKRLKKKRLKKKRDKKRVNKKKVKVQKPIAEKQELELGESNVFAESLSKSSESILSDSGSSKYNGNDQKVDHKYKSDKTSKEEKQDSKGIHEDKRKNKGGAGSTRGGGVGRSTISKSTSSKENTGGTSRSSGNNRSGGGGSSRGGGAGRR